MNTITIPKRIAKKGDLVVVPRSEWDEMRKLKKRLLREEEDTDEAIRIFEHERNAGTLKKAKNFSAILGTSQQQRQR